MIAKKITLSLLALCGFVLAGAQVKYKNPVYGSDFPDPTVIRAKNGTFYTYATGCKALSSTNLVKWTKQSDAIKRPTWNDSTYTDNGQKKTDYYSLWACDVSFLNGSYYMQYASALWGNGWRTGIGVAVSDGPLNFTDKGKLFRSTEIGVWNSIDPCFYQEKDKKYIIWGSFHDICIAELTDDGLGVKNFKPIDNPKDAGKQRRFSGATKIAGGAFEGPMIYKRGKYYYLFASVGSCCEGENSTYRTVVGRATALKGPYVNKQGGKMIDDNYTTIISGNDRWKGPGHNSEIVTDDEGQDWLLYHCYDKNNGCNGRLLLLDKIEWVDDWPVVNDGHPSSAEMDGPVFYTGDGANMTYKLDNADFSMSKFQFWNASSTGDANLISSAGSNVFMPFARATSAEGGATFDINQQVTSMKNGIYELRVKNYTKGNNVDLYVNMACTPALTDADLPTSDATTATRFLNGRYEQSAYGLVTNSKLTIGMRSREPMIESDRYAVADVRIVYREKNDNIAKILTETFAENIQRLDNTKLAYYKGYDQYLAGYLNTARTTEVATERYNALVKIQNTLDSLSNSINVYDSLQGVITFMDSEIKRAKDTGFDTPAAAEVFAEAQNVYSARSYTDKDVLALIKRMYEAIHNMFYVYKQGDGTKENPYQITTPEQLDYMREVMTKSQITYFELAADVDMKDIEWKQLNGSAVSYQYWINFDGKGHLIFNLHNVPNEKNYPSFFGTLCGECRNVGFVDAKIDGSNATGAAIIAGSLGYSTFKDGEEMLPVIVENCYVTGAVTGKGYQGAIGGNLASSPIIVRNVYSAADVEGDIDVSASCAGGLIGRIRTELTLEHAYAAGNVLGNIAGGVIGGGQSSTTKPSTFNNVFAWGQKVYGVTASALGAIRSTDIATDVLAYEALLVNEEAITDGASTETLRLKASSWGEPWHSVPYVGNGYPLLKWQVERGDYVQYCGFPYDPTAIVPNRVDEQHKGEVFDLSGRRWTKAAQRGIFIIDGKKVVK